MLGILCPDDRMPFRTVSGTGPRAIWEALCTAAGWRTALAPGSGSFVRGALLGNIPTTAWNPCLTWEVWGLNATEFPTFRKDERLCLLSCVSLKWPVGHYWDGFVPQNLNFSTDWLITVDLTLKFSWTLLCLLSCGSWGLVFVFSWGSKRQKSAHKHLAMGTTDRELEHR